MPMLEINYKRYDFKVLDVFFKSQRDRINHTLKTKLLDLILSDCFSLQYLPVIELTVNQCTG